ncbi:hypothetical protein AM506_03960 [Rossellomorea vietnamensis]|uniref:Uncharacterized protein n=1 Tax=Rossellomorea vietnamensis TaxID=218284 RepID=A0A0P6WWN9_9BACI|nr:hypothetical protein AM506_03960 [Rossellomorea vietnamensis]
MGLTTIASQMTDKKILVGFLFCLREIWKWKDLIFFNDTIKISMLSVAEGCSTPTGKAGQMRPRRQSRGGSSPAPRKASNLERNSTSTCFEIICELNLQITYESKPKKYTYNKPICQNNKTFKIRKILIN